MFHCSSYDRFYPFWDFDARRDAKSMVAALEKNGYRPKVIESDDGFGWGMWQNVAGADGRDPRGPLSAPVALR